MLIVIFRATLKQVDAEYSEMAQRLRDLALKEFGCLEFHAVCEGNQEVALSWWPDAESIHRWRKHPEHARAQQLGREKWYASYSVEIARSERCYRR